MGRSERKRTPAEMTLKIAGSFICFCIGSGFASGQDILQYFCAFGLPALIGLLVSMIIYGYTTVSALNIGFEKNFDNPMEIVNYYCGPVMGSFFKWAALAFYFMSSSVMISGFGAALNQHFGLPIAVGNIMLGVACIITVLLGLRGLVDVIGSLGPIIVLIAITVGASYFVLNYDTMLAGAKLAPSIKSVPTMGPNWFIGGLFYATWAPMNSVPFLSSIANTAKTKKQAISGGVIGVLCVGIATLLMIFALWCDYEHASQLMIPTLNLAGQVSKVLVWGILFIIFFGIYSSTVPNFFVLSATFFKEKTKGYDIFTIVSGILATAATFILPFNELLNIVFTSFGYLGILFTALMLIKDIRVYILKRNKNDSKLKNTLK